MAFLNLPLWREPLRSEDEAGESLDIELQPVPRQWLFPIILEYCCIYRVPEDLRRVNPEAYTPRLLIIGPLHHSLKFQALKALKSNGDATTTKLMNYLNMEELKKINLSKFRQRFEGETHIDEFRRKIERNEERIRASYSESTAWIEYAAFVDMILHDSVFILELILKNRMGRSRSEIYIMRLDLMLLENQLPYFILEELFEPIVSTLVPNKNFRELVITLFRFKDKIRNESNFKHFTDLNRLVYLETLPDPVLDQMESLEVECVHNAYKLDSGGVKLEVVEKEYSLCVRFENGCLKMPFLEIFDSFEIKIRNIMVFEQCHDSSKAYVCNYIHFMDNLIDTHKDVELLIEKGIIENHIGHHGSVAEMFNKLDLGIFREVKSNDHMKLVEDVSNII